MQFVQSAGSNLQANMCQYHYELHHEIVTVNTMFVLYVSRQAMPASLSQTCLRKNETE